VDLYLRGLFRVRLADGGARGNYAYVEDVVDGIVRAARHGQPGAVYTLGGENATFDEVLATLAAVTGRGNLVLALPLAVARGVGRLAEMAARFGIRPPITREWVSLFALDWPSSSDAAERDLGYTPRSLRDGIELTVRWLASGRDPWHTD
jgi:farnesol dehydrogenase